MVCRYSRAQSRIERESPAWTLFLPLSRQACKISRINEKNPAKHVGKKPYKIITFQIFIGKEACNPPQIIMIIIYLPI